MDPLDHPQIGTVLILKSDRLYAEMLRQCAVQVFPNARVTLSCSVSEALHALDTQPVDLLITGIGSSLDGDVLDLLSPSAQPRRQADRVLVVTARREYRFLACLRTLEVDGVFDSSTEPPDQFVTALRATAMGARYWSPSILQHMQQSGSPYHAHFRLLTAFEQVVLSVVGDGCDDNVAARELGLSPATVSTVRRELHRKLGVQHRGELVRIAAQHGFVRFTPAGVVRPGFRLLSAAYQARRARRSGASSSGGEPGLAPA